MKIREINMVKIHKLWYSLVSHQLKQITNNATNNFKWFFLKYGTDNEYPRTCSGI